MAQWAFKNRLYLVFGLIIAFVIASAWAATFGRAAMQKAEEQTTLAETQEQSVEDVQPAAGTDVTSGRANLPLALHVQDTDMAYGNPNAPVQIVEYASLTCGHCGTFHNEVWPKLRAELVQTGKVQFVFRFLPWDNLSMAVSKVVACGQGEQKDVLLSAFFKTQKQWIESDNQLESVHQIARMGGMTPEQVNACLEDQSLHKQLEAVKKTAVEDLNVRATPTLFINGERLQGVRRMPEINAVIKSIE
jgi:protein-disulfide isomerase